VAGHAGVLGNEAADKVADDAHELPLPLIERQRTEVAARLALIQEQARQTWRVTWKEGFNAAHFRYLAPEVTHQHLRLHKGRAKPHSALLTQLLEYEVIWGHIDILVVAKSHLKFQHSPLEIGASKLPFLKLSSSPF